MLQAGKYSVMGHFLPMALFSLQGLKYTFFWVQDRDEKPGQTVTRLTTLCRWRAAQLIESRFHCGYHTAALLEAPLPPKEAFRFAQKEDLVCNQRVLILTILFGSSLIIRDVMSSYYQVVCSGWECIPCQSRYTNWNILPPIYFILKLSNQIKIGGEIIPLAETAQLICKPLMKLDQINVS